LGPDGSHKNAEMLLSLFGQTSLEHRLF
jgi:hypothetical protein